MWGQFSVGVEVFDATPAARRGTEGPAPAARRQAPRSRQPHHRRARSRAALSVRRFGGRSARRPRPAGGRFLARRFQRRGAHGQGPGSLYESDPLELNVANLRTAKMWSGECDDPGDSGRDHRPVRPGPPAVFRHAPAQAVGGRRRVRGQNGGLSTAATPCGRCRFVVKEAGEYQFFIQTRGDFAVGAFPTAALYVDNSETPVGSVRLAGAKYHRVARGRGVPPRRRAGTAHRRVPQRRRRRARKTATCISTATNSCASAIRRPRAGARAEGRRRTRRRTRVSPPRLPRPAPAAPASIRPISGPSSRTRPTARRSSARMPWSPACPAAGSCARPGWTFSSTASRWACASKAPRPPTRCCCRWWCAKLLPAATASPCAWRICRGISSIRPRRA